MRKIFPLIIALMIGVSTVQAQEIDNSPSNSDPIFNKSRNTQKIEDLKLLYRDQIGAYRNSEKEFNVSKTLYFNVETLVALEDLVNNTEIVMKDRSKVLITYLELLSATLDETTGVELSLKQESSQQINSLIINLKSHQKDIDLAHDRASVNILADDFEIFVDSYNQVVYRALSLIRIGKMRAVYDAATIIDVDIKESQIDDEIGVVQKAKRDRAYQEIQRNFTITDQGLTQLDKKVTEAKKDSFSRSFYERELEDLEPIYIQLSKSLEHLGELLKL